MSVATRVKATLGLLVAGVLVVALAPWLDFNEDPKQPRVTNTQASDRRFRVQAIVAWDAGPTATVIWGGTGGDNVTERQPVDEAHGWSGGRSARQYIRNFGPYRRGDIFQLRLYAGNGPLRCALLTLGMKQQINAPAMVYGEDGQVTCRITVGD